jgi:hypothetical protein
MGIAPRRPAEKVTNCRVSIWKVATAKTVGDFIGVIIGPADPASVRLRSDPVGQSGYGRTALGVRGCHRA